MRRSRASAARLTSPRRPRHLLMWHRRRRLASGCQLLLQRVVRRRWPLKHRAPAGQLVVKSCRASRHCRVTPLACRAPAVPETGRPNVQPSGAPPVKGHESRRRADLSAGAVPDMRAPATVASRSSGNRVADANASLDAYQRQLAGMLENLQNLTSGKLGSGSGPTSSFIPSPVPIANSGNLTSQQGAVPSLFGSLDRSSTPACRPACSATET